MDAFISNVTELDWNILFFINNVFSCELMNNVMGFSTYFFGYVIWAAFALFLIIKKSTRFDGVFLAAVVLISVLLVQFLLKSLIIRDRPYLFLDPEMYFFVPDVGSSFPSSHTSLGFAASAYCVKISKKLIIPAYIIAVTVAFSRMYLFAHYPSDVLVGAVIGTVLGVITVIASKIIRKKLTEKRST